MTATATIPDSVPARPAAPPRWQLAAGVLLAVAVAALPLLAQGRFFIGDDFEVFHAAGSAVLDGGSPYDFSLERGFMFIYTPFAAIPLVPLALLGQHAALAVWTLVSVLALQAVVWSSLRAAGVRSPGLTLVVMVAALLMTPVLMNLWLGQINLIVVGLVVADLARRSDRWRGVGVGIAAGIKLTPLIFIVYLLITRQYRAARVAAATFVGTVLAAFVVLPGASSRYWGGRFLDTSRMFPAGADLTWNHSIRGLVALYTGSPVQERWTWLALAAVVGVIGLAIARWASLRGDELAGIVACGLTGVLVSPLSWSPHWIWCVPLLVVAAGLVRTPVLWVIFAAQSYYWILAILFGVRAWPAVPPALFTHVIVLTGVAALGLVATSARRRAPAQPGGR